MNGIVLCVRTQPHMIPEQAMDQFRAAFPGHDLAFLYVNPQTPEDLDEMISHNASNYVNPATHKHETAEVVAVYLQERPLPTIVVEKGETPCVVPTPGGLMRLKEVKAVLEPLT